MFADPIHFQFHHISDFTHQKGYKYNHLKGHGFKSFQIGLQKTASCRACDPITRQSIQLQL